MIFGMGIIETNIIDINFKHKNILEKYIDYGISMNTLTDKKLEVFIVFLFVNGFNVSEHYSSEKDMIEKINLYDCGNIIQYIHHKITLEN